MRKTQYRVAQPALPACQEQRKHNCSFPRIPPSIAKVRKSLIAHIASCAHPSFVKNAVAMPTISKIKQSGHFWLMGWRPPGVTARAPLPRLGEAWLPCVECNTADFIHPGAAWPGQLETFLFGGTSYIPKRATRCRNFHGQEYPAFGFRPV
jgi:hypothetical protein